MHSWPVHPHLFSSQLCHLPSTALLPPRVYLAVFIDGNHAPPQHSFCQIKAAKPFFSLFSKAPPSPPTCFPPACVPGCAPLAQTHWGGFNASPGDCLWAASMIHLQDLSSGQMSVWQRGNEEVRSLSLLKPGFAPILCRQTHVTNCPQCSAGPFSSC